MVLDPEDTEVNEPGRAAVLWSPQFGWEDTQIAKLDKRFTGIPGAEARKLAQGGEMGEGKDRGNTQEEDKFISPPRNVSKVPSLPEEEPRFRT